MIWADQTLDEGLRIGIDKRHIYPLIKLLSNLQVALIDIKVVDWQKYCLPPLSQQEKQKVRGKLNDNLEEIELAYQLGFRNVIITCAPSEGESLLKSEVLAVLRRAQQLKLHSALCIENASNFSIKQIEGLWREVSAMGVTTFIYSDGNSLLNPLSTSRILTNLAEKLPVPVEFHAHNAYGLATANALGAMQVGIKRVATAVAGVGSQGHAAMEEMIMIQKKLLGENTVVTKKLSGICAQVLGLMGVGISPTKAIIGQDIFAHESGIHVDGVLKNPQIYEAFSPNEVGLIRKIVIGKHSGTAALQAKFQQRNIPLSGSDAQNLLKQVRTLAVMQKKPVDDDVLWKLYQDRMVQSEG